MSTSVSVTPYAAASRRARSVSSALAAPEPKYFAVNAWGGASLASDQLATTAEERSEEHTSELQSQSNLVCRLLLEKKKKKTQTPNQYDAHHQEHCTHVAGTC